MTLRPPSQASAELAVLIKANVRARLTYLGLCPREASRLSGHRPTWLGDVVLGSRYTRKVSSEWIADVAEALGLKPFELLLPIGGLVPLPDLLRWLLLR